MKRLFLICLLFISVSFIQAQKTSDYLVIGVGRDTIFGEFTNSLFSNKFITQSGNKIVPNPNMLLGYREDGIFYQSIPIENNMSSKNQRVFMELVSSGDVSLYQYTHSVQSGGGMMMGAGMGGIGMYPSYSSQITDYHVKYNGEIFLVEKRKKHFLPQAAIFFKNNPNLLEIINNNKYRISYIKRYVEMHNEFMAKNKLDVESLFEEE